MQTCVDDPSPRSARAVLRLTREQLLARPGGRYEAAQPVTIGLVLLCMGIGAFAFLAPGPLAKQLRDSGAGYGAPLASLFALAILVNGRKLAKSDQGDRVEILAAAREAWKVVGPHCPELDDVPMKETRRRLESP